VLTFFEYLRQRSFESIVDGVRDALDSLEKEPYSSQFQEAAQQSTQAAAENLPQNGTSQQDTDGRQLANLNGQTQTASPRRRRGRPRKTDRTS
jgi:hypothetical protein